ncbi:MAG: hypothetical protein V1791_04275, partial [Pseudomonadota bacterium]
YSLSFKCNVFSSRTSSALVVRVPSLNFTGTSSCQDTFTKGYMGIREFQSGAVKKTSASRKPRRNFKAELAALAGLFGWPLSFSPFPNEDVYLKWQLALQEKEYN